MSEHAGPTTARAWVQDGWNQLHRQLPLAAWACWQQALRTEPEFPPAQAAIDWLLHAPDLPLIARTEYRFLPPRGADRRDRWNRALSGRDVQHLDSAEAAFRGLVHSDPDDVEARLNQALCLAWLGRNRQSIAALLDMAGRARASQEPSELDIQACTLAELLRQGAGAEDLADDLTSSLAVAWTAPRADLIARLARLGPVHAVATAATDRSEPADEPPWFTAEWLDRPMPDASAALPLEAVPRIRASLLVGQQVARFSLPTSDPAEMARLESAVAATLAEQYEPIDRQTRPLPIALMDAAVWRIRLPAGLDAETRARLLREWVEHFYEQIWIGRPRRSLATAENDALAPAAAALGPALVDLTLRARLEGLVAMREQLAQRPSMQHLYQGYPFDRLRRRLGLEPHDPASIEHDDVSCMCPEAINALDLTRLDRATLQEAYLGAPPIPAPDRLVGKLIEVDPRLLLSLDFPRFGLHALRVVGDRASWIADARRRSDVGPDERERLDLLEALDHFLRHASSETQLPVLADRFLTDSASLQRLCDVLEEAGFLEAAWTLEERGLRFALEHSRPWPVPDL